MSDNQKPLQCGVRFVPYDELPGAAQLDMREMYDLSFPEIERVDFDSVLVSAVHMRKGIYLYGMVDDAARMGERGDVGDVGDALAGLACVLHEPTRMPEITYVLYLAINPKRRGMGYGTAALSEIASLYPDQGVALDIETVSKMDESVEQADRENRLRRLRFYEKNGFAFTGLTFDGDGISYDLMFQGSGDVDFEAMRSYFSWLESEVPGFFF